MRIANLLQFISVFTILWASFQTSGELYAQKVTGQVLNTEGEVLAYANVYVATTGTGTTSNAQGIYSVRLPEGTHELLFSFLGYKAQSLQVTVSGSDELVRDVVLQPVVYTLGEAMIERGDEDPAYAIMRQVIARAKFHTQRLDAYTANIYVKGSGGLTKIPGIMRKTLEEEGVDTSRSFTTENWMEISYKRPNNYTQKVLAVRSVGEDNDVNPIQYINASFYEPRVAGFISPLSPQAFAWYRFKYLNSFNDRGYVINRIAVTPRTKGPETVEGELYVIEDLWALHTVDFDVNVQGIDLNIEQKFNPVQASVWMPTSQVYRGKGKLYGFGFEFTYVAALSNYQLTLNNDLPRVIGADSAQFAALADTSLAPRQLARLLREYEKEEQKSAQEKNVVRTYSIVTDSAAQHADSTFWDSVRPIPLSTREIKGYALTDSLAIEEEKKAEGDTLDTPDNSALPMQILMGGQFTLDSTRVIQYGGPGAGLQFNATDGYNLTVSGRYIERLNKFTRWEAAIQPRYAFARERFHLKGEAALRYGKGARSSSVMVSGGSWYSQYNREGAISETINGIYTFFAERNLMRFYDQDYVQVDWVTHPGDRFTLELSATTEERRAVTPPFRPVWPLDDDVEFEPNIPDVPITESAQFANHSAVVLRSRLAWRPFETYYIRNERKRVYRRSTPELDAVVWHGQTFDAELTPSFTRLEAGLKHTLPLPLVGKFGFSLRGGTTFADNALYSPDLKHFPGNQTLFAATSYLTHFYSVLYYRNSTAGNYGMLFTDFNPNRLLLNRFNKVRLSGLREHIVVNHLQTETQTHTEVAYSLSDIFRLLRVDFIWTFEEAEYDRFMVQVGISTSLFGL